MTTETEVCYACGIGRVLLTAKPGRTRRRRGGARMPIPEDMLIPTCQECGEEFVDMDLAKRLVALEGDVAFCGESEK